MISSVIQALFKNQNSNISEQKNKRQRIYYSLNTECNSNFICLPYTKQKKYLHKKRGKI